MANSVDPDQTAPIGAVCYRSSLSGSMLFTSILSLSVMLGNYLQQTTSADDIFRCIFSLAGPTVIHPQYYGVQTPWGIYPANIIQQQGQQTPQGMSSLPSQQMRNSSGRLTPSGQNENLGNSGNQMQTLPAQGE